MINWTYFPHSSPPPTIVDGVVGVFEAVETFFDTMYASERLKPPLTGIVVIGY